jgi:hypothetical protein
MQRILWPASEVIPCNTCSIIDYDGENSKLNIILLTLQISYNLSTGYSVETVTNVSDTVSEFSKGSYCWPFVLRFPEDDQRLPSSAEVSLYLMLKST